jgi:hypothetical protein
LQFFFAKLLELVQGFKEGLLVAAFRAGGSFQAALVLVVAIGGWCATSGDKHIHLGASRT